MGASMLVRLTKDANPAEVQAALQGLGLWTRRLDSRTGLAAALEVSEGSARVAPDRIECLPGVEDVCVPKGAHPMVDAQRGQSVAIGSVAIGGDAPPVLMAGPCSVESREQIIETAAMAARAGAKLLRGGAFKPRTSPYVFAGHGRPALGWLREAADAHGLGVVTEVMSEHEVDEVAEVADLIQVGSRSMQSFALLTAVGAANKPVLLKRGMAATIEEWLLAGEHLLVAGASGVVFCERGVSGFDACTRNLLDLGAVALMRHVHGQPVVVDPSHAAGRRDLIGVLGRGAISVGAHGLLVEAHPHASQAQSDGPQALDEAELQGLASGWAS